MNFETITCICVVVSFGAVVQAERRKSRTQEYLRLEPIFFSITVHRRSDNLKILGTVVFEVSLKIGKLGSY